MIERVISTFGIGAGEFILIIIVGLIVFGPSKLPEYGRSLGKLFREFKKAQQALTTALNEVDESSTKTQSTAAQSSQNNVNKSTVQLNKTTVVDNKVNENNSTQSTNAAAAQSDSVQVPSSHVRESLETANSSTPAETAKTTATTAATTQSSPMTISDVTNMIKENPIKVPQNLTSEEKI